MESDVTHASDIDALADRVAGRLEPGVYGEKGEKVLLTRRQLVTLATGGLSVGALVGLGFGEAEAQEAVGQVGTDSDRVDVFAAGGGTVALAEDIVSESITGGYQITIDGDTYEFLE